MTETVGQGATGLMSQVEYAKHRGVSKQAIGKMVAAGKIPTRPGAGGRKLIDAAEADFVLGENRMRLDIGREDPPAAAPSAPMPTTRESSSNGLTQARTETERYNARMAELKYRQMVGEVIPTDDVRRAMERCAEMLLRGIDQLPTKADDLATAFQRSGVAGVRDVLKSAARELKQSLSDNMRLTAAPDEEEEGE
ncbi:hypothetical protein [Aurantimonas sp. VKM B-3413]|uniref:hypothetical protein n=1 Tax=Aurantimonas sp. VKM B-3413 TaxID=2779401 RepID=UPI001E32A1EA|nr:hypothetical protein [Aurantimonas sp. VKM B-3413]MCB8835950.1 hypothetical protein [Aurantimonas sp. VKM B-3413]